MSLEALKQALPAYARDLALNLAVVEADANLTDQQKWGALIACAHAEGVPPVIRAIEAAATEAGLTPEALTAAKAASAVMAMNNVYFRSLHLMKNAEYQTLPARLRMNVVSNPGVEKTDFELWSLAVSAINGCGACLDAHEAELRKRGMTNLGVQAALRIAAVTHAICRVMAAKDASAVA